MVSWACVRAQPSNRMDWDRCGKLGERVSFATLQWHSVVQEERCWPLQWLPNLAQGNRWSSQHLLRTIVQTLGYLQAGCGRTSNRQVWQSERTLHPLCNSFCDSCLAQMETNHVGSCRGQGRRLKDFHGFLLQDGKLILRTCPCCSPNLECPKCEVTCLIWLSRS